MGYPNPGSQDQQAYTGLRFGFRVDRATATLPQTATTTYFTVAGGRVAAFFLGEVTVALGAVATNGNLVHTPTGGTVGDLCGAASIASKELGCLFGQTGVPGDAMLVTTAGVRFGYPVVLKPGSVGFKTSASDTGETKWTCWYMPLDEGAYVTAA